MKSLLNWSVILVTVRNFTAKPIYSISMAICTMLFIWCLAWVSIASQIGKPFPGFFYNPIGVISSFTPTQYTGFQAGLRPWDVIIAVDGQSWHELPRLVQNAGIGKELVYTIERGNQYLDIPVRTMEFTSDILVRFLPGFFISSFVFLLIGIFVYTKNPTAALSRYLLAYLLVWSIGGGIVWECFLSVNKWMSYLLIPYAVVAPVAGWIFFWNFPSDTVRRKFLRRWPVVQLFIILGIVAILLMSGLQIANDRLENRFIRQALILLMGWPYFLLFGLGSILLKGMPLVFIILRQGSQLLKRQASVMLVGLLIGLAGWYMLIWAPASIHVPPLNSMQLGGLIPSVYPISIGYAILRYRLLDIRIVLRKGLIYSLLTAVLSGMFILLALVSGYLFNVFSGRQSLWTMVIPALVVAFLFQPLHQRIQLMVDQTFFRREYEIQHTITHFIRELSTLRGQKEVVQLVRSTVQQTLGSKQVLLWLINNGNHQDQGVGYTSISQPPLIPSLVQLLKVERRPFYPILEDDNQATLELHNTGSELAIPLFMDNELRGILALGKRKSEIPYSLEDLDLLTMLANSTALALENARLHEERIALLREQFFQISEIQEQERSRIARELHDGLGPSLASLNIRLQTLRRQFSPPSKVVSDELEDLTQLTQANMRDVRRLIYDLRPTALDELGLIPAMQEYVSRFEKDHAIRIKMSLPETPLHFSPPVETTLFRILQEALANIAKHARAHHIEIILEENNSCIVLVVSDDGVGFNVDAPLSGVHLGLWSMRKRVEQLRGVLLILSEPGSGTRISVQVPVNGASSED